MIPPKIWLHNKLFMQPWQSFFTLKTLQKKGQPYWHLILDEI